MAAREKTVFQRELEYRRLEHCPLCGKRGWIGDVRRRREEERDGARQRVEQRREEDIDRQVNVRNAAASVSVQGRIDRGDHPRAGQLIQRALEQGTERAGGDGGGEAWERTCTAQRMTPQRSPFQTDQAGSGVAVHGPLLRHQTPYPRFVVTPGAQAARSSPPMNVELQRNEDAGAIEDRGSRARIREAQADGGE